MRYLCCLFRWQVPFLFKDIVDALAPIHEAAVRDSTPLMVEVASAAGGHPTMTSAVVAVPGMILLGCKWPSPSQSYPQNNHAYDLFFATVSSAPTPNRQTASLE